MRNLINACAVSFHSVRPTLREALFTGFHSLLIIIYRTNAEFLQYINSNYLPEATPAQIQAIGQVYPNDITQGSPFDTGTANAATPEFKRLAAIQGDIVFTAPRRLLLDKVSAKQHAFVFREPL